MMKSIKPHILFFFILSFTAAKAQDTTMQHMHHETMQMDRMMMMPMHSNFSSELPMQIDGSGTAWLPEETPMHMYMLPSAHWQFMVHGNIFFRYTSQNFNHPEKKGSDAQVDAPNMFMLMGSRKIKTKGLFSFSTMFSLDPLTVTEKGYPLLFQTGEVYENLPLVDIQHPHDLIAGLSLSYTQQINSNSDVYLYIGYPGEPALGPSNFMHRFSAFNNPDAPLSHHWQDATHISFGVATIGYRILKFKAEISSFTGREPDDNRYNFDKPTFDSYAYRLSYNPDMRWSIQFSQGYLNSPEKLHPGENVFRTTASAMYVDQINDKKIFAATFVYGSNAIRDLPLQNSFLLEANYRLDKFSPYMRFEWVEKPAEELNITSEKEIASIRSVTGGVNYVFVNIASTEFSIGSQISVGLIDASLRDAYGNFPLSGQIYLKINPGEMMHM